MRRMLLTGLLAVASLAGLSATAPARALLIAPAPVPQRVAQAKVIVVGRVTAMEDQDVTTTNVPGGAKVKYRVAIVNVTEGIKGAKDLRTVRVAFVAPNEVGNAIRPRGPMVNLQVGQEGMFFLTPHHEQRFYTTPMYYDVVNSQTPDFAKVVAQAKQAVQAVANPMAGLQSKDAQERTATAAQLIYTYRQAAGNPKQMKLEAIDAKESKLILKVLAEADWSQRPGIGQMHPWVLFNMLGLSAQDGWTPPRSVREVTILYKAAQAWLREHGGTYRIQRMVAAPQ